jgi:CRISPR-associated protein Cas5t
MPEVVIIEAVAPVASWRPPEALTYHRSLPLPPYTTLVGVLGAAMGLGLPESYRFVADQALRLGVGGWCEGQARDLWKFQKLKDKEVETDVLLREMGIDARLALVIEAPDPAMAHDVAEAFAAPAFPLTAGPSDALLKVVAIQVAPGAPVETRSVAYAQVFREIRPRYELHGTWADLPIHRTIRAPSIERLPTGFAFERDGKRRLAGRAVVSFVADPIDLDPEDEPIVGYPVVPRSPSLRDSPAFVPWKERIPWIIPVHRFDSPLTPEAGSSTPPSPSGRTPRGSRSSKPTAST